MDLEMLLRQRQQKQLEEAVYRQLEVELAGQTFDAPRSYGHAVYRVAGGHGAWKTTRDAQKIYGYLDENGQWVFQYPGHLPGFCLAVVQLGGYDGLAGRRLNDLLEPYRQRLLDIRGVPAEEKAGAI